MKHRAVLAALVIAAAPAVAAAQVANPHADLGGRPCSACHAGDSWRTVNFDHRQAGYPLRGRHLAVPCTGCHDVRNFRGAVTACATCHQDPHRGDAGSQCVQCHTESGWRLVNANDAHARSRLPDLGVHAILRCDDCHRQTGVQQFHGRTTPCVGCHLSTYNATTNPSHAAIGFAQNCEGCHQMSTWNFALFAQHDAIFGIYSGTHAGTWSACSTCHPVANDFRQFTCTICHSDAATTPRHAGIPGYQWTSTACLSCHPAGRGGDLAFHETVFPITTAGHAGAWSACTDCHVDPNNRQTVTCMGSACHVQSPTDASHAGIPGYGFTTPQCRSCHPDGRGGTFAQHDAIFQIFTGVHRGRWSVCADCHTVPGDRSQFRCAGSGCHNQTEMNQHHQGIQNYQPTATACLACHPNGRKP
jgi:hypothetical protein